MNKPKVDKKGDVRLTEEELWHEIELSDMSRRAIRKLKEIVREHFRLNDFKLSDYEQGKILIKQKPDEDVAAWMDRCHELEVELAKLKKESK
jgi:hypothetical protein